MGKFNAILLLAIPLLLAGCFGRPALDKKSSGFDSFGKFGLQEGKPAVIVFSAVWCHPCREEIETLNLATREFGDKIQFLSLLVEGEEKGSRVQEADLAKFVSFKGEKPEYPLGLDVGWAKFDSEGAPQGHALPTMMLYDSTGERFRIFQQSLDYQSQLRPLLLSMAQNAPPPPVVTPTPTPAPGLQQLTDSVGNWLLRSEVAARPEFEANLNEAWLKGLEKFGFTEFEMPIETGVMNFAWDGASLNVPQSAKWEADTPVNVCKLQLTLNEDASFASASGSCVPK